MNRQMEGQRDGVSSSIIWQDKLTMQMTWKSVTCTTSTFWYELQNDSFYHKPLKTSPTYKCRLFGGFLTGKCLFYDHGHKLVYTVWQQTAEISCSGRLSNVGKFMLRTMKRVQNTSELTGFTVNRPNGQISVSVCLVLSSVRVKEHCHHHQMKRGITT